MPLIKLNANLRTVAGVKQAVVQGDTLFEAITNLTREYPALEKTLMQTDQIREHFILTINGHHSFDLEQLLNENDIIAIFPPISGG